MIGLCFLSVSLAVVGEWVGSGKIGGRETRRSRDIEVTQGDNQELGMEALSQVPEFSVNKRQWLGGE